MKQFYTHLKLLPLITQMKTLLPTVATLQLDTVEDCAKFVFQDLAEVVGMDAKDVVLIQ